MAHITPEAYDSISRAATRMGMTNYEMAQLMAEALLRYMDDRHSLDPELRRIIRMFEFTNGQKVGRKANEGGVNLAMPGQDKFITSAIYLLGAQSGVKQRAVLVPDGMFETCTYNIQDIFSEFMRIVLPGHAARLKRIMSKLGTTSMVEALDILLDELDTEDDDTYIRELFADNERSNYGRPIEYKQYQRRIRRTIYDNEQGQEVQSTDNIEEVE